MNGQQHRTTRRASDHSRRLTDGRVRRRGDCLSRGARPGFPGRRGRLELAAGPVDRRLALSIVPVPDTADLRAGAPIHDRLLALLPLVGMWHGTGTGAVPGQAREFAYAQHVEVVHDGRPFLAYQSRAWLVDDAGMLIRLAWRESGFWRPGAGPDDVEVVLASNTGQTLVFSGHAGDQQWQLDATSVIGTPTSVDVDGERRFYAVRGDELLYATELAPAGQPFAPHLNARLSRA